MTLGSILKSVLGPSSSSHYYDHPAPGSKYLYDRNGGEYYHFGHYHKTKGKSKSDKKHAILSALSLLSFLFFLNILQNCIREQTMPTPTVMMFGYQAKTPSPTEEYKTTNVRVARSVATTETTRDEESVTQAATTAEEGGSTRKSRSLLSVTETVPGSRRRQKFIGDLEKAKNWTNELTQVSDKDLEDQKLKTLNFPLYWKNNRLLTTMNVVTATEAVPKDTKIPGKRVVFLGKNAPPTYLRRLKKRERSTPEPVIVTSQTATTTTTEVPPKTNGETLPNQGSRENPEKGFKGSTWFYNISQTSQNSSLNEFVTNMASVNGTTPESNPETTQRIRRSDYIVTAKPLVYGDSDPVVATPHTPDLASYQAMSNQNYPNHRFNSEPVRETETYDSGPGEVTIQPESDPVRGDSMRMSTEPSQYYYPKQPYLGKKKVGKYPNHQKYYLKKGPVPLRYRNSPYRRIGSHESGNYPNHLHGTYYPVVLARYPDDEDTDFDLIRSVWSLVTSFAKPLTKLVPSFGKDGSDEPQCYDLVICEVQRASKFMGPTAEAFASTVGTVLTWAVTEETRPLVVDAIKSGKENTCQQQIKDCENRSGGRSAMTVIAQVLEVKVPQ